MTKKYWAMLGGILLACGILAIFYLNQDKYLFYDISAAPETLDPQLVNSTVGEIVLKNMFMGLYTTDEKGQLALGAAEKHEISPDGNTHTFTLREQQTWSDKENTPVVADDFVFAFQRVANPATKSPYIESLSFIKGAKEVGKGAPIETLGVYGISDRVLVIELNEASSDFSTILSKGFLSPCNRKFFEESKGAYGISPNDLISNGSFYLSGYKTESHITMERNKNAYVVPKVSLVKFLVKPDEGDRQSRFADKTTSMIYMDKVEKTGNPIEINRHLLLFESRGDIFSNQQIREAFVSALDMEKIRESFPSYFSATSSVIPPYVKNQEQEGELGTPYQGEKAKQAYKTGLSQLKRTELPTLTFAIPEEKELQKIATDLAQMWQKELGIFVSIQAFPLEVMPTVLETRKFDILLYPYAYKGEDIRGIAQRLVQFSSASIQKEQEIINATSSKEVAIPALLTMEQKILTGYFVLPLSVEYQYFVVAGKIEGILLLDQGLVIDFRFATL